MAEHQIGGGSAVQRGDTVGGQAFPAQCRLRRPAEFRRCYRGLRRRGQLLMVVSAANGLGFARLGLTVSRKVGPAVVRNRLKRWTREWFRRDRSRARLASRDLVVHFFPAAAGSSFHDVNRELGRLVERPFRDRQRRSRRSRPRRT